MGAAGDAVDEGPVMDMDPGALTSPDAATAASTAEGGEWPMRRAASALLVTALVLVAAGVLFLLIKHTVPAVSGWAGAALASSAMAALGWYVFSASDAIEGARRVFGAFGLALVSMWVAATFARVPVRPEEIFNAFLIAGFVLLLAAWAMRHRSRGPWLMGLVAAGIAAAPCRQLRGRHRLRAHHDGPAGPGADRADRPALGKLGGLHRLSRGAAIPRG